MITKYDYTRLIGFRIIKGEVLIKRKLLSAFMEKGYDITFEQWTVLNVLYVEPGLIQSEIAEKTYKDKTNVTRILDVLSKNGYLVRENHESDRRSSCVFLTDAGRKMFDDLIPYIESINEQFRKGISDAELEMFTSIMERICKNAE
ncbi:MarR family winged helix-turn-helix transcriptional regulator [Desulfosporosinus nitroreducens]|uniref:MarR family transcriptional regulator n=1 Tax=Desulfosporosinus nitroreducens TaxID=2018668 RepID=A0ABT8QP21_9FIRM|nr:MarR family transcriptional regulator [Desulfosporosinus nitroreducens]MDO0823102.1 MarR family transcriptional regulator [Desulfosporosinus nitroreducens]